MKKRNNLAYIFLMPWFFGVIIFKLYPFVNSLLISFQKYNLVRPQSAKFIGFDNYIDMFTKNQTFIKSITATGKYVLLTVPLVLGFSLFIAYILNFNLKGVNFFRTAYYIPSILGGNVAIATLWRFLFENNGLINAFLESFGIEGPRWYSDPKLAIVVISLLRAWQFGSTMVIFLAALQNVPRSLYEAGKIDGASESRMFFSITVPIITPVILFNFVMRMVHAFQEFNSAYLITDGGPLKSTYLLNMYIYEEAFQRFNMGYASAITWIMFVIITILTMLVFRSSKYWVYYSD